MTGMITTGLAVSPEQRDRAKALNWPGGFYQTVMLLLCLSRWRLRVQPDCIHFCANPFPGPQHCCKLAGAAALLYGNLRRQYPNATGKGLVELGFVTIEALIQQGYNHGQIHQMALTEKESTI